MTKSLNQNSFFSAGNPKISSAELNSLAQSERLEVIRRCHGKTKYNLLLEASDGDQLVPQLHPQEIYLTVNAVGPDYAAELLLLASTEQITNLIDLDCWEGDRLDPATTLRWLALLLETGEEKVCRTLEEMDPELVALLLKLFIRVISGPEAYDNDDADGNANRLEGLYDIDYRDEEAAKIVGGLLKILQQSAQPVWIQLLELVRSELDSVLEEEVFQARGKRLLDYGFASPGEARGIYSRVDPQNFAPAENKDFSRIADGLENPTALLRLSVPGGLLAEILAAGIAHDLASELSMLANRKLAADRINPGSEEEVADSLAQLYDGLNLALEHLSGNDPGRASALFNRCYLQQLFQLGNSLIAVRAERAAKFLEKPLGTLLDGPYRRFIDSLNQTPPQLYRGIRIGDPQQPEAIRSHKQLHGIDSLLTQIEAQQCLLGDVLTQELDQLDLHNCNLETAEELTLSDLFLTALANQLLGGEFAPTPLPQSELATLHQLLSVEGKLNPQVVSSVRQQLDQRCPGAGDFADYCLEIWQEEFCRLAVADLDPRYLSGLIVRLKE